MKTVLGAQMYTLREFMKTPKDMDITLGKVKEMGYDAVQISGGGPIDPHKLKDIMDRHELKMICTHTPIDRIINDTEAVINEHKLWNCKYIGIGSMPAEARVDAAGVRKFIADVAPAGKKIADAGLMLIYHNHNFEFQRIEGKKLIMDILFEETNPETFQFEIDTYWVQSGGADPIYWINKVAGRMDVIHFKDMKIIKNDVAGQGNVKQAICEIGEGNINIMGCIEACAKTGVKWHVVEQDICDGSPFDSLKISLDCLHRLGLK